MTNKTWRFQADIKEGQPIKIEFFVSTIFNVDNQEIKVQVPNPLYVSTEEGGQVEQILNSLVELLDERANSSEPIQNSTPKPSWASFNTVMYQDPAYQRIRATTPNQDAKITLESLLIATGVSQATLTPESGVFFQTQWQAILSDLAIEDKPTPEEISIWNNYSSTFNLPISFTEEGLIVIS